MMKRLLFFAALIVAIGSIGGNMLTAHAQILTPAQAAALQQQLEVAKATLANLEMQAGVVPPADAGTPSRIVAPVTTAAPTGLSAEQINAFKTTLNTLAETLTQLDTSVVSNSSLTPSQQTAVQATLNGMQGTLVAMANEVANGGNSPVANNAPVSASAPVAVNSAPATATMPSTPVATAPATPSTTVVAQTQPASVDNAAVPQTAQASSLWSFTKAHWPTIVIVLLVIAILAILFWPEKKESVRTVSISTTSGSGKPKSAPISTATIAQPQNIASASAKPMASTTATPPPATPVANAVAAPSQK